MDIPIDPSDLIGRRAGPSLRQTVLAALHVPESLKRKTTHEFEDS